MSVMCALISAMSIGCRSVRDGRFDVDGQTARLIVSVTPRIVPVGPPSSFGGPVYIE